MRVVFMGTPDFSVPALEALYEHGHEIAAVITQPDKPRGRGKEMQFTPVKQAALNHNITVYQPEQVKSQEFIDVLKEINPDVMVVVAFGQILTKTILDLPKYGCINIHASLLPRYRGAAPIQRVIIDGESITGVTTMKMDEGIDTGDMIMHTEVSISEKETGGSLHDKLALVGGKLIVETLEKLKNGTAVCTKQDSSLSNYAKMLNKKLGNIDFTKPAVEIERLIRGLNPWPSAYTSYNGKMLKIWDADVDKCQDTKHKCGEITGVSDDSICVCTGDGTLVIRELQLAGKKRMYTEDFLRGVKVKEGEMFE